MEGRWPPKGMTILPSSEITRYFRDEIYGEIDIIAKPKLKYSTYLRDILFDLGINKEPPYVFEIWRMTQLRQAGLSYIVKYVEKGREEAIRASWNRLTHAAGTLYLGNLALENIEVVNEHKRLGEYLENKGDEGKMMIRNFLLALFLHDSGHPPYSHVLENSMSFRREGFRHEDVSVDLVLGGPTSMLLKEFLMRAELYPKKFTLLHEVLAKHEEENKICRECIAALMNKRFNKKCGHFDGEDKILFNSLRELVDGTVDLDRLDHYLRDDKYLGIGVLGEGVKELIEALKVDLNIGLYVEARDVSKASQLLDGKKYIWERQLDRDAVRYCEALLILAVDTLIDECQYTVYEIALMTDKMLAEVLKEEARNNEKIKYVWDRFSDEKVKDILKVEKERDRILINEQNIDLAELRDKLDGLSGSNASNDYIPPAVFWHGGGYTETSLVDLLVKVKDSFMMLHEMPMYKDVCDSLRYSEQLGKRTVKIFVRDSGVVNKLIKKGIVPAPFR